MNQLHKENRYKEIISYGDGEFLDYLTLMQSEPMYTMKGVKDKETNERENIKRLKTLK